MIETIKKYRTLRQKQKDFGIEINFVCISVNVMQGRKVLYKTKIDLIYKKITIDIHNDKYTMARITDRLKLPKNKKAIVTKVEIIKNLGYGINEEEKG
jgi:hypothetical protein